MNNPAKFLRFSFGRKLPIILQTEVAECGLACLAMISSYHGYETDLLSLRRRYPISLKGSKLQDLISIASKYQLLSRPLKLELEDLKLLSTPCILHWDLDHFVVLKEVKGNKVIIHDPALGIMKYTMSQVSEHFTGVAMELTPAARFEKRKDKSTLRLADFWQSIGGLKFQLLQVILVSLALQLFEIVSPFFIQLVTDEVLVANDFPLLYVLTIGFVLLMVIKVIAEFVRSYVIVYISNILNIQLVTNLLRHLFRLPLSFFERRHLGDIVSRFDSLSMIQEKLSTDFVVGIVDGIMIILTLVMMLIYSPLLTLVVLLALAFYIALRVALYPAMRYRTQESIVASAKESSIFMESIKAILPLKVFSRELQREVVWQNSYIDKLNAHIRLSKLELLYRFCIGVVFGLEHILIVFLGARSIMNDGGFSIGMLMAYLSYRQQFVAKAQNMVEKVVQYKIVKIHLERVADVALTPPEIEEGPNYPSEMAAIQGNIKADGLSFRYSEHEPYIFKDINFTVSAGEVLVIVGPSGCGKTTLLKVLLGLLPPTDGNIFIDNSPIKKIDKRSYRSQIAAVMQDDSLLSGSLADNICFFDPEPDWDRLYTCAMIAAIHDDIVRMPMAYQTLVGDMGSTLSGGQKQRVLLARALYARPKILFLDEATSNLDLINEDKINNNINQLGITRIIISHRKEATHIADKIIDFEAFK